MSAFYVKNVPGWERALRLVLGAAAAAFALYSFAGPHWLAAGCQRRRYCRDGLGRLLPHVCHGWAQTR